MSTQVLKNICKCRLSFSKMCRKIHHTFISSSFWVMEPEPRRSAVSPPPPPGARGAARAGARGAPALAPRAARRPARRGSAPAARPGWGGNMSGYDTNIGEIGKGREPSDQDFQHIWNFFNVFPKIHRTLQSQRYSHQDQSNVAKIFHSEKFVRF